MTADETLEGFHHRFEPGIEGSSTPTLLLLHGTGGDEHDLLGLGRTLSRDAHLLSPRGQVLERGQPRFFRRFAAGVFDVEDLRERAHTLAAFVAAGVARYGFDPGRVTGVGFSNGANIAAGLLLLHPETLAGAILLRPSLPFEPAAPSRLDGVPVLICAGHADTVTSPGSAERLAQVLGESGADVTLRWDAGGHAIGLAEVEAARDWFAARRIPATRPS